MVPEVSKKLRLLQIFIRLNNNNLIVVKSHPNQIQLSLVKWCTRLSKTILIWETAYSLEVDKMPMVFKVLYILATTLIKTQIIV